MYQFHSFCKKLTQNLHGKITNADIVGNVQVTEDGVASGFNINDYLTTQEPFNPGNNSWEIVIKCMLVNRHSIWVSIFYI